MSEHSRGPYYPYDEEMSLARAILQMEKVIDDIAYHDKAAYLEAKSRVPALVATETNPIYFLRYANFDTWAAARRLVEYWSHRKSIFLGRAFLPLVKNGLGALDERESKSVSHGQFCILPDHTNGEPVVLIDFSKTPEAASHLTRARSILYCCNKFFSNERIQSSGIRCILVIRKGVVKKLSANSRRWVGRLLEEALPMRTCSVDVVFSSDVNLVVSTIASAALSALKKVTPLLENIVSTHRSPNCADALLARGFRRDGIPEEFGGTLSLEKQLMESENLLQAEDDRAYQDFVASGQLERARVHEDPKERRKMYRRLFARRQRAKERKEKDEAEGEYYRLLREKEVLESEGRRLASLLEQANAAIRSHAKDGNEAGTDTSALRTLLLVADSSIGVVDKNVG